MSPFHHSRTLLSGVLQCILTKVQFLTVRSGSNSSFIYIHVCFMFVWYFIKFNNSWSLITFLWGYKIALEHDKGDDESKKGEHWGKAYPSRIRPFIWKTYWQPYINAALFGKSQSVNILEALERQLLYSQIIFLQNDFTVADSGWLKSDASPSNATTSFLILNYFAQLASSILISVLLQGKVFNKVDAFNEKKNGSILYLERCFYDYVYKFSQTAFAFTKYCSFTVFYS